MKKNQNILEWILFSVFTLIGIFFVIAGIIWCQTVSKKEQTFIKTKAEITDVRSSYHFVQVTFVVNGKSYETELSEWNSGMKVGDKIEIFYNPQNPSEIIANNSIGYWIFIGIGTLFICIGLVPGIIMIQKKRKRKYLLQFGKKVQATIDNVSFKMNYSVNGRHPYILECSYIDKNGKIYFFKSDSIWYPIEILLEKQNIKTIPVYIDINNPKRYYVELENLNQYIGNEVN